MKFTPFQLKLILGITISSSAMLGVESHAAPAKLKVGVFLPMSGGTATFGEEVFSGMKLAIEEVNANKDVKLDVVLEDEKSDVSDSANAVKKLINVDKVNVVLGSVASSNTNAAAPIAQAAKIPLITPASTNVNVTQKGEYISRICFIDDFQGLAMAKFAYANLGKHTAAIVTDSASDYSMGLAKSFREAFTKLGGQIVTEVSYAQNDQDFSSQLTKIRTKKPDVVFAPGYYNQIGIMIRQARTLGVKSIFMGGDGWSSPKLFELAGEAIVGNYYGAHFSDEDPNPIVKTFVAKYKAKYNKVPSDMAALGYDTIYFTLDAFKRAGNKTDAKALMTAINATKGFKGVTGVISLDASRNASKPLAILETQKTRATFKQSVAP
ncbi:MAG: ABC transporter substrate-binding protein [Bdellovibrionales bacterium]|nr:ABC transporter substrate-binding protein [Bdellovibrionales bacterium]